MIALLSIGTEITTGQILNTNAQWLSTELLQLGLQTTYQISVPDSAPEITAALHFLEQRVSQILITGGLGPTADDFTRKVLAETYSCPLLWNEENWKKVQSKLSSKKVPIRSLHRQQCEYPNQAEILPNEVGVADGFTFSVPSSTNSSQIITIYALPGPPKELKNIWENHLRERFRELIPESSRWIQTVWTIQGVPESEIAYQISEALGEEAAAQVLYRAYSPFIDVKLLYRKNEAAIYEAYGQKIKEVLKPWLVSHSKNQGES